jgi:hypothetical protein
MLNFDLRAELIDPDAGQLTVAVTSSPVGEVDAVRVAVPPVTLAAAMSASSVAQLHNLAAAFTDAVLPHALWTACRASVAAAGRQGVRLRLRTVEGVAAALPWELLYDSERAAFFAHDPSTPVVRYLEGWSGSETEFLEETRFLSDGTLTLLLTSASPVDLPLLSGAELDAVTAALAALPPARLSMQRVDHLTAPRLEAALVAQRPALFHFSGHGFWSAYAAEGGLALESAQGQAELLDGATLAMLLGAAHTQIVVLNACATAQGDAARWSGLAQGLVRRGAGIVVAQQTAVDDDLAQAFAAGFYRSLAGDGDVERAVCFGRISMAQLGGLTGRPGAWLAPVLFARRAVRLWGEAGSDTRNRASLRSSVSEAVSPAAPDAPPARTFTIGTVNAVNFQAEGVMHVDMTGATITLPAAQPLPITDAKLDQLLAGQTALAAELGDFRTVVLTALSGAEQRIVADVLAGVDERSRHQAATVMLAVQRDQIAAADVQPLLTAIAMVREEAHSHGAALAAVAARLDALAADEVAGPTDAEFKHRVLITAPIVPFLLSYEGEVELKSRLGLDAAWQALLTKVRGR